MSLSWVALLRSAAEDPIGVDISDYGDEFCGGFLAGQLNVLQEIAAGRLELPAPVSRLSMPRGREQRGGEAS